MRKTIVMTAIVGMILVSFASAGLVDFLSNPVSGTVEVKGPVFYTASSNELIMNEEPSSGDWNKISSGSYVQREWVMCDSESLNGIDFYNPEVEFTVNVEIASNFSIDEGIGLEFGFYDMDGRKKEIASYCDFSIDGNGTFTFKVPDIAYSNYVLNDVNKFYYALQPLSDKEYKIKTKDTYVEITGVYDE